MVNKNSVKKSAPLQVTAILFGQIIQESKATYSHIETRPFADRSITSELKTELDPYKLEIGILHSINKKVVN